MAVTAERQRLTELLLDKLEQAGYPSQSQLERIERLISSREELEDYIAVLMQKVGETRFSDAHLLDRIERLLVVLQSLDREPD